ncbi:MAG TPA: NUDIX domain-containing protein [Candidatus Limnocylindria bacterium]|nr:NUDIX domain-containing protein [Candidatus Limnocylindria bacterium]
MERLPRPRESCGRQLTPRSDREVAILVQRDDRLLLLHRAIERYWHVVAGVVEGGESFGEAAVRELREETGLATMPIDLALPQRYRIPPELLSEYPPEVTLVSVQNFWVTAPTGWEPVLNEEHDVYRWCSLTAAVALAHWPETKAAIAALARLVRAPGPGPAGR